MWQQSLKQQPINGRSIFVDMNSFFASVEQQAQPELRGKPVGVCPFVADATCVIAASIEAKQYGIKTGTRIPEAKRLYPGLKLVAANPRLYREYHRRILSSLENLPCHVQAKSIDEALLLVPGYLQPRALDLGEQVKAGIRAVGDQLKCSVGVAPNMFLAKMGTNIRKPDGLIEVRMEQLAEFYDPLQLMDLHGISWNMRRRLHQIGIMTPLDFFEASASLLRQNFGVNGEAWYLRLRGYEVDLKPTTRRIIGHQQTITPRPAETRQHVLSVASQLTYRAAIRLRQAGLAAKGIVLYIRFNDHTSWQKVYHGREPFFDSYTFYSHVQRLLKSCPRQLAGKPVRLVSVSAIDLVSQGSLTLPLFTGSEKSERISQALDEVNFRYGENSLITASQLAAGQPRDAIGFGNSVQNARELPK